MAAWPPQFIHTRSISVLAEQGIGFSSGNLGEVCESGNHLSLFSPPQLSQCWPAPWHRTRPDRALLWW